MKHFFLDANVVMDFLTRRAPFAVPAADLFQLAEEGQINVYVSSLSFSHLFYLLRKAVGSASARSLLIDVSDVVTIVAVDSRNVKNALHSAFGDFEDALQYYAAHAESEPAIEAIVTRDPAGFTQAKILILSPTEALQRVS